jgi:hypothetical protein
MTIIPLTTYFPQGLGLVTGSYTYHSVSLKWNSMTDKGLQNGIPTKECLQIKLKYSLNSISWNKKTNCALDTAT